MKMRGVRPSSRTTSMRRPSMGLEPAQPRKSSTARSMWPCSRHWASNMGDFAGILMYSVRVGMMLSSQVFWTKSRTLPESSAIAGSSGGDAEAGADLPELLKLERRVDDPGELAAEATVDEGRLATDVRAVALGTAGRRSGEESLRGPLQGVLGSETDDGGRGRHFRFHPLRLRHFHERRPLYSRRSEEHTSELQSPCNLVCRLLLEKKNITKNNEI